MSITITCPQRAALCIAVSPIYKNIQDMSCHQQCKYINTLGAYMYR